MFRLRITTLVALIVVTVSLCLLAGCTTPASQNASTSNKGDYTETAMVAYAEDGTVLLVNQQTDTPYFPTLPEGNIFGINGKHISVTDLVAGNIVSVEGNGIMLESYPAQYPGITKVTVISQGSPADADKYASLVAQVISKPNPDEVPTATLEYATDLAQTAVMLEPFAYEWRKTDGATIAADDAIVKADGTIANVMNDIRTSTPLKGTLSFTMKPSAVRANRMPIDITQQGGFAIKVGAQFTPAEVTLNTNGKASLTVEPASIYEIVATFPQGEASYCLVVE